MKDERAFIDELNRPFGVEVSAEELEREGEDFMAFAKMFGVSPELPSSQADAASA